ncbi:oxidoreductase [Streptomyces sp. SPB78]|nr:oxidoreductase [Streptomyces sp. SPB78]
MPHSVLDRDLSRRYEPSEQVEAVWAEIYRGDQRGEEVRLGEALTDVGELVWRWRNDHLTATRRAMGSKQGTGGSAGVAWLEKRATKSVFPELWTARGRV